MSGKRPPPLRQKLLRDRAREMRNQLPKAELLLWLRLRDDQLGVRIRRQFRIDQYIVDFACPTAKVAIEIDGESHGRQRELYDAKRSEVIQRVGYCVLRFKNDDIFSNLDTVVEVIAECFATRLRPSPLPSPRVQGEGGHNAPSK